MATASRGAAVTMVSSPAMMYRACGGITATTMISATTTARQIAPRPLVSARR